MRELDHALQRQEPVRARESPDAMLEAKRTLVKSGPELWAEVSDPEALAGHLSAFGDIRITRTAGSSLVEWEGERAVGRLALEPSGFGTRVVLSAEPRGSRLTRFLRRPAVGEDEALAALTRTLDRLGTAHHRPFSR